MRLAGRLRSVDHPPGHDDLLVFYARPFDISDGDLAVRTALQCLQEVGRDDGLGIALALDGQFLEIHRVGHVDRKDERDIDFLGAARDVIRHHHERWDGTGYPHRLRGDANAEIQRVIGAARDVLDNIADMTSQNSALQRITRDLQVLLLERADKPGFWQSVTGSQDAGETLVETAIREVREETGLDTEAVRLLALWDKRVHPHPPQAWYVYKAFVLCRPTGGATGARWCRAPAGAGATT